MTDNPIETILNSDDLNHLINQRNYIAHTLRQFHLLGHQAIQLGTPTLAKLCFDIADQLALAKARADRAILLAASDKASHA